MNINKININQSEPTYYIASDIYDVTANNNDVTFESLSALLSAENLSTLIPTAIRCGGMAIRFVQSSNNKYAQYRLMANTFSTDEYDWEEVGGTVTTDKLADKSVTTDKLADGVIVQDIGNGEQSVMSQKAVSDKLYNMITFVFSSKDFTNFKGNNKGFVYIPISVKKGDTFSLIFNTNEIVQFTAFAAMLITDEVLDTSDNSQQVTSTPFSNTEYSIVVNSDDYKFLCIWLAESSNMYGKHLKVLYKGNNDTSNLLDNVSNLSVDVEKII